MLCCKCIICSTPYDSNMRIQRSYNNFLLFVQINNPYSALNSLCQRAIIVRLFLLHQQKTNFTYIENLNAQCSCEQMAFEYWKFQNFFSINQYYTFWWKNISWHTKQEKKIRLIKQSKQFLKGRVNIESQRQAITQSFALERLQKVGTRFSLRHCWEALVKSFSKPNIVKNTLVSHGGINAQKRA